VDAKKMLSVDAKTRAGWTPLHLVASKNHTKACQLLLSLSANTTMTTLDNKTAAQIAMENGHVQLGAFLQKCDEALNSGSSGSSSSNSSSGSSSSSSSSDSITSSTTSIETNNSSNGSVNIKIPTNENNLTTTNTSPTTTTPSTGENFDKNNLPSGIEV